MKITYSKKMKFVGIFDMIHDDLGRIKFSLLSFSCFSRVVSCGVPGAMQQCWKNKPKLRLKTATSNDLMLFAAISVLNFGAKIRAKGKLKIIVKFEIID